MSDKERVQQQVTGIISGSGLRFAQGDGFIQVLAPGLNDANQTTAVRVRVIENNHGRPVVSLLAPVLFELPSDDVVFAKTLSLANLMNQQQFFGRWVYYPESGTLIIEHELYGEDLDESELMAAVITLGQSADEADDKLMEELGAGERLHEPDVSEEITT